MVGVLPAVGGFQVDVGPHVEQLLHLREEASSGCHHQSRGAGVTVPVVHCGKENNREDKLAFENICFMEFLKRFLIVGKILNVLFQDQSPHDNKGIPTVAVNMTGCMIS